MSEPGEKIANIDDLKDDHVRPRLIPTVKTVGISDWDVALDYMRKGFLPPPHLHLSGDEGRGQTSLDRYIVRAMLRTIQLYSKYLEAYLDRLDARKEELAGLQTLARGRKR